MLEYSHAAMEKGVKTMIEEPFKRIQAFQQVIATTVTCRTLIKYNTNLSGEQKDEILAEIETALAFLNRSLAESPGSEADAALASEELAALLKAEVGNAREVEANQAELPLEHGADESALRQLYRLYQAYLNREPGRGLEDLERRYRTVMDLLDQLQDLSALRPDTTAGDMTIDGLLDRVRGFITAIYGMFREFAVLLAKVLEGRNIDVDTESLALLQAQAYTPEDAQQLARDIVPLMRAYERQRQWQQQGSLREQARDATAFLVFLQDALEQNVARRQEVITHIKSITGLFNDLISLLMDYELAATVLMQSQSRLR